MLSAEALASVNLATGVRRGEAGIFERGYKCRRNADRLRDSEGDTLPSEDPLVRRLASGRSIIDIACNSSARKRKEEVDWRGERGMACEGRQAHLFGNKGNCPRSREESLDSREGDANNEERVARRMTSNEVELMQEELAFEPVAATVNVM